MYSRCRDNIVWRTINGYDIVLRGHAYQQWSAIDQKQEPMTRSMQLPHIPVTAFLQTDLCLVQT